MSEETLNNLLKTCRILLDIAKKHTNQIKALQEANPSVNELEGRLTRLEASLKKAAVENGGASEKEPGATVEG